MAEAILITKAQIASSHKGVISLFGKYFVKTGVFEKELGKNLNDAYDKRQIGDYGVGFTITQEEAKEMRATANYFIHEIKSYLEKRLETEGKA